MDALSEAATIAVLAERVENLDEKLDSTRQRFDEHLEDEAGERRAMTAALEGIRFDVHAIREGKKAVLRMLSVGLFILGATGKWTLEHALTDWQTQHDPSRHKEIDP
jgi:hypothetical protein